MIEKYYNSKNVLLAYTISSKDKCEGINFISDPNAFFQTAEMSHKKGHIIQNHFHNTIKREIDITSEAIIMRKGLLRVFLFENMNLIHEFTISDGDILILLSGGHGFEMLEDSDFVEIKQGPFLGDADKTRF